MFLWPDFLHLQNQEACPGLQGPQMLFSWPPAPTPDVAPPPLSSTGLAFRLAASAVPGAAVPPSSDLLKSPQSPSTHLHFPLGPWVSPRPVHMLCLVPEALALWEEQRDIQGWEPQR